VLVGELIAKLRVDKGDFDRALDSSKKQAQGLGATLSGIFKQGLSFAAGMGIFQALKAGFNSTIKAGWDLTQTLETARIGFTTMMGSAGEANRHIREMVEFAARTPFQLEGLLAASQQMQGMGIDAERVIPTLRGVGDALAASGRLSEEAVNRATLALGQMSLRGKVASQEMLQLTEAGIPAWSILAEKMGVSTEKLQDLVSRGAVPAQAAIDALAVGLEERFGGSMDKISRTVPGMWSTIRDNVQMFMSQAVRPAYEFLEQKVMPWVLEFTNRLSGFSLAKVSDEVAGFISGLGVSGEDLKKTWKAIVQAALEAWSAVRETVRTASEIVKAVIDNVWPAIYQVIAWVMGKIGPLVQEVWGRVMLFIREVMPIIRDIIVSVLQEIRVWWEAVWPHLQKVLEFVWSVIGTVVKVAVEYVLGTVKFFLQLLQGDWTGAVASRAEAWVETLK
jgi:tape measure domain-containing protein